MQERAVLQSICLLPTLNCGCKLDRRTFLVQAFHGLQGVDGQELLSAFLERLQWARMYSAQAVVHTMKSLGDADAAAVATAFHALHFLATQLLRVRQRTLVRSRLPTEVCSLPIMVKSGFSLDPEFPCCSLISASAHAASIAVWEAAAKHSSWKGVLWFRGQGATMKPLGSYVLQDRDTSGPPQGVDAAECLLGLSQAAARLGLHHIAEAALDHMHARQQAPQRQVLAQR